MKRATAITGLALLAAFAATAAEVVVYSPYDAAGFTLKAPSGTYRCDKSFTGHRAVVTVPDPTNAVIEAWAGSGDFSVRTAYGTSAGLAHPAISLTLHSPVLPRISLTDGSADRGKTVEGYAEALRQNILDTDFTDEARAGALAQLEWLNTNRWEKASVDASSTEMTRVRIVRWAVDGQPVYRVGTDAEVVFDKKMLLANRAFLTEADILADGGFDLDWAKLKTDVVDRYGVQLKGCPVTNVAYLVVIGDGKTYWNTSLDTNSCPKILDRVIERKYGLARIVPTPVSGTFAGGVARFKFRIDGDDVYDPLTPSYTAFQVGVRVKGATSAAWSSGVKRLPAKMPDAAVYAFSTDDAALASAIASGKSYEWVCAIYNAKFSDTPAVTATNTWSSASLTVR